MDKVLSKVNMRFRKKKASLIFIVLGSILAIYALVMFSLLYYAIISSCKDLLGFINDPIGIPAKWHFENYLTIISKMSKERGQGESLAYIENMFFYSVIYSVGCAISYVACTTLMSYACAQYKNFVSKIIYLIVIFTLIFPIIGALPSEMLIVKELRLYDNWLGNFFLKFNFTGIYFLVLYEYIKAIPKDYREAAEIDGANQFIVMFKIIIPMCFKTIGAIFLVQFVAFWNDYQTPLLYLPHRPTIAIGLLSFTQNTSGELSGEPLKLAAALIVLMPILIIFMIFQKKLIGNVSAGGIKG